ncbi:J domain-containing protein [Sphingomonas sp.]|uniref:J domain-containing protein n=1 Tax=Sphingomonas sp. TaxID=28214 RepID=UPI002CAA27AF|nr:DnaJ domain-containing protein [Sphingomonas sp.]HWK35205.1 DnaJ domain-containing protein [Sphingomonas sp.]
MTKVVIVALIVGAIWWYLRKPAKKPLPDVAEARAILGIPDTATADDVRAAHRRLVGAVHPDRGGSAELTGRINAARDVLLRRLG